MRLLVLAEFRDNVGGRMLIRFILGAIAAVCPLLFFEIWWPEFVVMAAISGGLITAAHKSLGKRPMVSIPLMLSFMVAVMFATTSNAGPLVGLGFIFLADLASKRICQYDNEP